MAEIDGKIKKAEDERVEISKLRDEVEARLNGVKSRQVELWHELQVGMGEVTTVMEGQVKLREEIQVGILGNWMTVYRDPRKMKPRPRLF